jgi:PTS system ascorbate-specific IIA component
MVGIAVLAHAPLASALVSCAEHVLGHSPEVLALDVQPGECAQDCSERVASQLKAANHGEGILVLADLPGASPCNIAAAAAKLLEQNGIPVIVLGGASAAMLVKAINYRHLSLSELALKAQSGAIHSVTRID